MLELVDRLRKQGYRTGLLTNRSLVGAVKLRQLGSYKYFDTVIISSEVGFSKPEPQSFKILAENLGIKLDELVFIDDSPEVTLAAESLGIKTILFKNYHQLVRELSAYD